MTGQREEKASISQPKKNEVSELSNLNFSSSNAALLHNGNEPNSYYFHADHLGSTSAITDANGSLTQHVLYFAYGETFVDEHRNSTNSPYLYNGKEYDTETSRYYYGARYYDPRISLWIGVDPLADSPLNFGKSPYTYVWNNPLKFIDPTGMLGVSSDETYGVDSKGKITKIDDKKYYDKDGTEVDMLVVGHKIKLNKKSEIKNRKIEVEKGRLDNAIKKRSISDGKKSYDFTYMNFGENDEGANNLFTFLAENTDVEWAIFQKDQGFAKITEMFTSHLYDKEVVGASLLAKDPKGLIYHIHSHPRTNKMNDYSRLSPSDEDKSFAKDIRKTVPDALFYIHFNYEKQSY